MAFIVYNFWVYGANGIFDNEFDHISSLPVLSNLVLWSEQSYIVEHA